MFRLGLYDDLNIGRWSMHRPQVPGSKRPKMGCVGRRHDFSVVLVEHLGGGVAELGGGGGGIGPGGEVIGGEGMAEGVLVPGVGGAVAGIGAGLAPASAAGGGGGPDGTGGGDVSAAGVVEPMAEGGLDGDEAAGCGFGSAGEDLDESAIDVDLIPMEALDLGLGAEACEGGDGNGGEDVGRGVVEEVEDFRRGEDVDAVGDRAGLGEGGDGVGGAEAEGDAAREEGGEDGLVVGDGGVAPALAVEEGVDGGGGDVGEVGFRAEPFCDALEKLGGVGFVAGRAISCG